VKNHETQTYRFLQQVERNFILLLTATPLQNSLRELYNLVTLLRPGQLGTWRDFRKLYVLGGDPRKAKNPEALRELTSQVMVRTRRANVAAHIRLPPRRPWHPAVVLTPEEMSLYRDTTAFLRDLYKNGFFNPDEAEEEADRVRRKRHTGRGNLARLMVMLCQRLCSSAVALADSLENLARGELVLPEYRTRARRLAERARTVSSHAKLQVLTKLLTDVIPEQVIVFTEHLPTLRLIEARVAELGRVPIVFAGPVPRPERNRRIQKFKATQGSVFLTTRAGAEGLNLQFCRCLVNYELPWNPMVVEQRIGRIHRIGQEREVHIINLALTGTIEEHVLRLLDQKIKLFELVVGELDVILGKFGEPEDLEKQLTTAWLSSTSDQDFERQVETIGEVITESRREGLLQEQATSEIAAEDSGLRLEKEFHALTIAGRVRLGYGTVHLQIARGVEAKRNQLGLRIPEIQEALQSPRVTDGGRHPDYGVLHRLSGESRRKRPIELLVKAETLPMVLVDLDAAPDNPVAPVSA
jgi:SNF2 family DNA or RNA helicase